MGVAPPLAKPPCVLDRELHFESLDDELGVPSSPIKALKYDGPMTFVGSSGY